jgi:hypothetical protein
MKKWLLIQQSWKNADKTKNLHNIKSSVRRTFDDYEKLKAYIDMLKDMKKMGEISKDVGFSVVEYDDE